MHTHVAAAAGSWTQAAADADAVLARVALPPRGPIGSRQNDRRVRIVAAALHQAKVSRMTENGRRRHRAIRCPLCRVHVPTR